MENVYTICGKFIQETTYQVSSQLPKFYRRYYKNILVSFFLDTLYITKDRGTNTNTNYRTTLNKCIHSASSYQISAQSDNPWSYCDITSKTTFNFSTVGHLCKWTLTFPMPLRILMQHIKIISAKSEVCAWVVDGSTNFPDQFSGATLRPLVLGEEFTELHQLWAEHRLSLIHIWRCRRRG